MKPRWILIANATFARLLEKGAGKLAVVQSFTHSEGRSKVSELVTDRAGHESTDRSYGGTSYQPRTDPKRKEHKRFAHQLATHIERHAVRGDFESLALFASSPFLGELKAELGPATALLLTGTHDVDLTAVGPAELERRIEREVAA